MPAPVVVGADGSDSSLAAVDWAADAAARHRAPLRVVYGSLWEHYDRIKPSFSVERDEEPLVAAHLVASAAERAGLRQPGIDVMREVLPDDAVAALLKEAESARAVVVGHRGRGELTDMLLGSTSLTVAARASCPVVVVRGAPDNVGGAFRRVLLAVGDQEGGSTARVPAPAAFALDEAAARGGELVAVRAWRRNAPDVSPSGDAEAAARLTDAVLGRGRAGVVVRREAVEGPPRRALLAAAADADLLVVGARRHRRHALGLQLGATSHALLHHAPCPVAVVPYAEGAEPGTD
ncbi:universal stress protein [Streptomyces sp. ICBB 8177]|uniref:universal stress protein n=1 Tax=Streptomyces sp. ICBB 8177 TaxID=563922 RepID=UPI000D67F824|nr:universal stress protein [Streptomyces sp. ICBB 8177]PWI45712.1 universal stress protein [Streptomyces sp. ICBB 8177]